MARRKAKRHKKNQDYTLLVVAALIIGAVVWLASNPDAASAIFGIALLAACAYGGWWYWQRQRRIERRRFHAHSLGELLVLTPAQFEQAMGALLSELGYRNVQVTGKPGDLAADITCRDGNGGLCVVQCKRYGPGNTVGSQDVQAFIGMRHTHYGAAQGIFITTSAFTAPARLLASQHDITLMDGPVLTAHMQRLTAAREEVTTTIPAPPPPPPPPISPDGQFWWDGVTWQPMRPPE